MNTAELHVHCCRVADIDPALLERHVSLLDDDERRRLEGFHAPGVRDEFLLSRILLRSALASHLCVAPADLRFTRDDDGKPHLAPPFSAWHFNLSHGRDWIALASSTAAPVGIDIESHARKNDLRAIARRFFSAAENEALRVSLESADEAAWLRRFFATWTLKEAHAKALGCGLSKILSCSSFVLDEPMANGEEKGKSARIELQLSGIAASATAVTTRLYRPDAGTSLAISQLGAQPARVALYRWTLDADGAARDRYFELAPVATGSWSAADPGRHTDRPRA